MCWFHQERSFPRVPARCWMTHRAGAAVENIFRSRRRGRIVVIPSQLSEVHTVKKGTVCSNILHQLLSAVPQPFHFNHSVFAFVRSHLNVIATDF